MELVKKVIVVGHYGVGKTSLIKRFVHQQFSDQYLTTIGVKIDKKEVVVGDHTVKMMIWDIAGESDSLQIPQSYFMGAHAAIFVFDLTRKETYESLDVNSFNVLKHIGDIPSIVIGNKCDLLSENEIEKVKDEIGQDFFVTSAKTGGHVEESFELLAKKMI